MCAFVDLQWKGFFQAPSIQRFVIVYDLPSNLLEIESNMEFLNICMNKQCGNKDLVLLLISDTDRLKFRNVYIDI